MTVAVRPERTQRQDTTSVWEDKRLEDLVDVLDHLRVPLNSVERQRRKGIFPYCGANGILDYIDSYCVDDSVILMAEDGGYFDEYATRPIAYRMSGKFWVNNHAHILKGKPVVNQDFVYHSLVHKNILPFIASGTRAKLNKGELKNITILLPEEKAEQTTIADALNDADAYIESLEQMLAKKRAIMQGAMHELLAGKRRLPGFNSEWLTKSLGTIAHVKTGSRNTEDRVTDGRYPFFIRSAQVHTIDRYSHDCEAILVPGEGGIGSIFHYIRGKFAVHQRVYAITQFTPDVVGKYVYYFMTLRFGAHAMEHSVKATVDSLRLPTFQRFSVALPPSTDEQGAIAAVLSDMDSEIAGIEAKAAKARYIKQGMMQSLLTGKVRLI